MERRGDRDPAA